MKNIINLEKFVVSFFETPKKDKEKEPRNGNSKGSTKNIQLDYTPNKKGCQI